AVCSAKLRPGERECLITVQRLPEILDSFRSIVAGGAVDEVPRLQIKAVCLWVARATLHRCRDLGRRFRSSFRVHRLTQQRAAQLLHTDCAMSSCTAKMSSSVRS